MRVQGYRRSPVNSSRSNPRQNSARSGPSRHSFRMNLLRRIFGRSSKLQKPEARSVDLGIYGNDRMTIEELVTEGERLKRPCILLKTEGVGRPVAWWHRKSERVAADHEPWITFDTRAVPGSELRNLPRYLSLLAGMAESDGVLQPVDLPTEGLPLFGHALEVIAPIEAVFAFGNERVGAWLEANNWPREERYNSNFPDKALVEDYQRRWSETYPAYRNEQTAYAVLGGWHFPHSEDDWYELAEERLLVLTIHDAEPWIEGWQRQDGQLDVIQRIT